MESSVAGLDSTDISTHTWHVNKIVDNTLATHIKHDLFVYTAIQLLL